ncbi:MAG: transposase family protein [Spirochaetaceae bacterium]|jgi:hypothetical protein|nr:transposase family protein [Spirochaetaceae bacterium]
MGLTMQEKKAVTRQVRSRYQKAGRKEKSAVLDEFISITGYKNRKYALRLLNKPAQTQALLFTQGGAVKLKSAKPRPANRKGKKIYTDDVTAALRLVWTFFWYKCGKLLAPLMRQQMDYIALWPAFGITPAVREKLMRISPAATDVASGWICLFSLLNKAHRWTFAALRDIHVNLPFPLREFHSDNGGEFINHVVTDWLRNPACPISFTRSRDHKKNDNCFVEQKNGAVTQLFYANDEAGKQGEDRLQRK